MGDMQEPSTSTGPHSPGEQGMTDTFATVWVKVEVNDDDDTESNSQAVDINPIEQPTKPKKIHKRPTKQLFCDKCEYTTVYRNCLKAHVLGHSEERPYSCTLCPYGTIYSAALSRHILTKHPEQTGITPPMYHCSECDYKTIFKSNLKSHSRKHQSVKNFKCLHCTYRTAYKHTLAKHERTHGFKDETVYTCDKCPFATKYEGHIKRHKAAIHNEIDDTAKICEFCGFATKLNWRLNIHRNRSLGKVLLKCIVCGFETYYTCQFRRHKKTHPGNIYMNGKVIKASHMRESIVESHVKQSHSNEDSVDDTTEEFNQDTSNNLEMSDLPDDIDEIEEELEDLEGLEGQDKHGKKHHYVVDPDGIDWHSIQVLESDDREKPFKCLLCEYTSKFKSSVQRHFQRNHTSSTKRPYRCVNCGFSTKTKDQIALHNKRSKSVRPVQCKQCSFMTYYKCKLVMHRKIHYEFKCTECDYSCKEKYPLAKHYNTYHLGFMFQCEYCDYKGSRKESLEAHVAALHTGNKPFKCPLCDYTALRYCLLDCHFKRHHSDVQDLLMKMNVKNEHMNVNPEMLSNDMKALPVNPEMLSNDIEALPATSNVEANYAEFSGEKHVTALHTENKPFKCPLCDYTALRYYLLDCHFKRHHSDVQDLLMKMNVKNEHMNVNPEMLNNDMEALPVNPEIDMEVLPLNPEMLSNDMKALPATSNIKANYGEFSGENKNASLNICGQN